MMFYKKRVGLFAGGLLLLALALIVWQGSRPEGWFSRGASLECQVSFNQQFITGPEGGPAASFSLEPDKSAETGIGWSLEIRDEAGNPLFRHQEPQLAGLALDWNGYDAARHLVAYGQSCAVDFQVTKDGHIRDTLTAAYRMGLALEPRDGHLLVRNIALALEDTDKPAPDGWALDSPSFERLKPFIAWAKGFPGVRLLLKVGVDARIKDRDQRHTQALRTAEKLRRGMAFHGFPDSRIDVDIINQADLKGRFVPVELSLQVASLESLLALRQES